MTDGIEQLNAFGLKVSSFNKDSLFTAINHAIDGKNQLVVYGYSLGILPEFKRYPEIYKAANKFDIMLCDGHWFYLLLRAFGFAVKTEISIPNFILELLNYSNTKTYSMLLLGADQSTNVLASKNIADKYSQIRVLEGMNGYFKEDDEEQIVKLINERKPDILLIGISSPKKELFAKKWKAGLEVPIIIPCGGMIDVLAGKTKVTPVFFKKLGLATVYRVLQEPQRLLLLKIKQVVSVFFILLPALLFNKIVKGSFSIPKFYGIKEEVAGSQGTINK